MVFGLSNIFVLISDMTLTKTLPSWVFLYMALANFAYQTFDAVDGIHARAIKASSPLGQLFDHGIDALLHGIMCCTQMSAMRMGSSIFAFIYFQGLVVVLFFTIVFLLYGSLAALL